VTEVLGAHGAEVTRYKSGETKLMAFFVGQVMKTSKGKADPKLAQTGPEERLASQSQRRLTKALNEGVEQHVDRMRRARSQAYDAFARRLR